MLVIPGATADSATELNWVSTGRLDPGGADAQGFPVKHSFRGPFLLVGLSTKYSLS